MPGLWMPFAHDPHTFWKIVGTAAVLTLVAGCAYHPVPLSGADIRAALSDHTALLPGGFVEYYAPDGKLYGWSDGLPYDQPGRWEVKGDLFCTALGGDEPVCSPVGRDGDALFWSIDGDRKVNRVATILPGNPRNLK
jgi:hypothetical protein